MKPEPLTNNSIQLESSPVSNGKKTQLERNPQQSSQTTYEDQIESTSSIASEGNETKLKPNEQKNLPIKNEDTVTFKDPGLEEDPQQNQEKNPLKSLVKRGLMLLITLSLFGVGGLWGWRWWQFGQTHVTTDNAQIQGHLSPISAKISATVQQVLIEDGDPVEAGQILIILEDQDLNLKIQQAQANLRAAQAHLKTARDTVSVTRQTNPTQVQQAQSKLASSQSAVSAEQANVHQMQAKVETEQANVAQAQTLVNKTLADFRRYEFLYEQGAVSAQQFDTARAAYEDARSHLAATNKTVAQAQAEVKNAQAQLKQAQAQVEAARGQVAETQVSGQTVTVQTDQQQEAQAQVEQAKAALALARQQLKYTLIKSPIKGTIGQLTAQMGQKVQPEQPLLSVVPLQTERVYVQANFKETQLGKLHIGQPADIEVDAYPQEKFHATIAGISPATGASFALIPPDNATGNFNKVVQWVPVRLVFNRNADPQHKLRPGLNVKVTVNTAKDKR
ncbi:HlyD family secretion protein [Gloeothece verrucosa]|uniref:Secretion protein HlyD family protein n=1 Tax=Gloeothece verrucosa (strain PCC 7822) TaxID=497965 RepID=E0UE98_GLOV7|nr:HlyD family secretion protein [Gloeothece verrucosa]ADN14223.1 secretion protein HlyD family protein [Gloeothece verrucosa PCC 7822]